MAHTLRDGATHVQTWEAASPTADVILSVEGWKPKELTARVAAVRQLYVDALEDWSSVTESTQRPSVAAQT